MVSIPPVPRATGSSLLSLSLLLPLLATATQAQMKWLQRSPATSPTGRNDGALAYDSARGRTVMFGGFRWSTYWTAMADTWEWDGSNWTKMSPRTSPPRRAGHEMVYDSARRKVVLFGGGIEGGQPYGDTWEWNGNDWAKVSTNGPPIRGDHVMAYDSARQRVVLFGGYTNTVDLGDTWEWDGKTWAQKKPTTSPAPRRSAGMAYDAARKQVILFGGLSGSGGGAIVHGDSWAWNGANWRNLTSAISPSPRLAHGMTYDSMRKRVVLFGGGILGGKVLQDTWAWGGTTWTAITTTASPTARAEIHPVYQAGSDRVVLFGGYEGKNSSLLADTWEFRPDPSAYTSYGSGCAGASTPPSLRAASPPRIGNAFGLVVSNIKSPAIGALVFGASNKSWNGSPLPMDLASLGMNGCRLLASWDAEIPIALRTGGAWTWGVKLPLNTALIGATFFNQAWVVDPGANALGVATTNGGEAVIGF